MFGIYLCEGGVNYAAEHCEVIIVDDGSVDDTQTVANRQIEKFPQWNIKYVAFPNGGVGKARNRGLEIAQGEYVWFVDPDDEVSCGAVEKILLLLDENPNIDGINFGFDVSWHGNKPEKVRNFITSGRQICNREILREKLLPFLFGYSQEDMENLFKGYPLFRPEIYLVCKTVWQLVIKKSVLIDNGLVFREGMTFKEDTMFVLQYLVNCNELLVIPDALYHYSVRGDGAASKHRSPWDLYLNKKQVFEEKTKAAAMLDAQGWHGTRELYVGSVVLSALELFVEGAKTGLSGYRFAKGFCVLPANREAIEKLKIGNAPLKYRIPIILLKRKAFRVLYLLLYMAQRLGVKASL